MPLVIENLVDYQIRRLLMLRNRILTIIVLVPLLVWAIYAMPRDIFSIMALLVCMWIAWEWSYVCAVQSKLLRLGFVILCAVVCAIIAYMPILSWAILIASLLFSDC